MGRLEDQQPPIIIEDGPHRIYASAVHIVDGATVVWRPDPSGQGGRVWIETETLTWE